METYLVYIGKSAIAAGAFYIAFLLLFQNQKHFVFNRIYLPVSLALSFVIPLITFTTVKYIEPVNFDVNSFAYLAPASGEIVQPAFVLEWYHYLFGLYLLGTAGFLFHLLLGHLKAIKIIQKSRVQKIFSNLVNITQKDVHPFSFFSKIVLSEKTVLHPDLEMIVSHENIHVREKHTLDILFTEIIFLFQWFNPFAWLLKDAVKNNLEYLTDHEIAKRFNPQTYQLAMVTLADKQGIAPFLTALNGSQLKNRIVMMKKKTENKYAILKQLVVLPLLAVLVMGLSNNEVKTEVIQSEQTEILNGIIVKGKVTDEKGTPIEGASIEVKGTTTGTITDSNGNYELQVNNGNEILSFLVPDFETVNIDINGQNVIDVQLKSDESGKNSVVKVNTIGAKNFTLKKEDKNIVSGKVTNEKGEPLSGANVLIKGTTSGTMTDSKGDFKLNVESKTTTLLISMIGYDETEVKLDSINDFKIVLKKDGVPHSYEIKFDETKKSEEIEVVGYGSTESRQPQSASFTISGGMNGTMQKGSENVTITPSSQNGLTIRATSGFSGEPLYVVDGIETTSTNLNKLSPDSIESISVLKDQSATALYGDKGKNGVVVITTKKYGQNNKSGEVVVTGYGYNSALLGNPAPFGSAKGKSQPLILVNGKETGQTLNNIDPATIESVYVLKDETATKKYGEKGKNGVLEISLKNGNEKPKITTQLELRRFIAEKIKYPKDAQEVSKEGIAQLFINLDKNGKIITASGKASSVDYFLDEVVVTANKNDVVILDSPQNNPNIFVDEIKRVADLLPIIDVPEFKGKTIGVTVKFELQETTDKQTVYDLRSAIARSIKYPVVAQENNQQGVVEIWAFIAKDGTISRITDKRPDGKFINVDEVVVTALKSEKAVTSEKSKDLGLLVKESKRVIEQLSPLTIPELAGEMVCFRIKFVLE